ncbi:MAG: rRNA maturation RNase YbeY [Pseudomonadota bacterium]
MTVDLIIEDERWTKTGLPQIAERACTAALGFVSLDPVFWDVALLACDDARITELNAEFRGKPKPTNVLSWPSQDRAPTEPGGVPQQPDPDLDPELGDLAIAYETCLREAESAGRAFDHHVAHLIVHGTLHLLGYDHESEPDADRMESLEVEILASLGVENPY